MAQQYKSNAEVQADLAKVETFLVSAIEEDFDPIKVKMFLDYDLKDDLFVGNFVGSNNITYSFQITQNGVTTLTRK